MERREGSSGAPTLHASTKNHNFSYLSRNIFKIAPPPSCHWIMNYRYYGCDEPHASRTHCRRIHMNNDSIEARTNYLLASTGSVFGHEDFQALA